MKRLVLATRNRGKIREINALFAGMDVQFAGLDEFPDMPEVMEDGETFEENAFRKARDVFDFTGMPVVSEDSGLEVDALGGSPGVYSARFAGENATDGENLQKLMEELSGTPPERRTARFVSVFCLYDGGTPEYFRGHVEGMIIDRPRGESGFGYDPVFVPRGYDRTFAELGQDVKNRISHRAEAIRKLQEYLRKWQRR